MKNEILQKLTGHGEGVEKIEAFVRESSLCAATNCDETLRSLFALSRSIQHYELNIEISESEINRVRCANASQPKGRYGLRANKNR